jgi:hypothetical protein
MVEHLMNVARRVRHPTAAMRSLQGFVLLKYVPKYLTYGELRRVE